MKSVVARRACVMVVLAGCSPAAIGGSSTVDGERGALVAQGSATGAASSRRDRVVPLASFEGRYERATGRLVFQREGARRDGAPPRPGFVTLSSSVVSLDDHGTSVFGPAMIGGESCASNQVCAEVALSNDGDRSLQDTRVEITDLSGGATLAGASPLGSNYPSSPNSAGGYYHGSVQGGSSASALWRFDTDEGADFSFRVVVWGAYWRTGYIASAMQTLSATNNGADGAGEWSDSAPAWRDACLVSGSELFSAQSEFTTVGRTPAFPFVVYDALIDTDGWTSAVEISSAGTVSLYSVASGDNLALTHASATDYTYYAFWDDLESTSGAVCAALDPSSSAPHRRYVVTWKNVNLAGLPDSRLTFSAVFQEGTDDVWYLFHKWSTNASDCSSSGTGSAAVRGGGATIGVRGNGVSEVTEFSRDTAVLPSHDASCPGDGAYVKLTAIPVNP